MVAGRKLLQSERALGHSVFGVTIPFDRVFIGNLDLGSAVTKAGWSLSRKQWVYEILWPEIFASGPGNAAQKAVFIHELVHVWQGENGLFPHAYMGQSAGAQLSHGIADIIKTRTWRGWGSHRSTAYKFTANDIGKHWNEFNVEQQGNIVESWFMSEPARLLSEQVFGEGVTGGGASQHDPRYPYIRDVIRASNRHALYRAIAPMPGADPQIRRIQDALVALGYLDAKHADGTVGRSNSATLDALRIFQSRNGLKPDRQLGGPNSLTRRKLALPAGQLVPAPSPRRGSQAL